MEEGQSLVINDEYRRSVRNSLIWSGLTFLVAVGSKPDKISGVDVTFLGTGLLYPQWGATLIGFLIATYMLASFDRIDRRFLRDHREFFFARSPSDVSAAIAAFEKEIRETAQSFAHARAQADQARSAASSLHSALAEHYDRQVDPIRAIYNDIEKEAHPLVRPRDLHSLASRNPPLTHDDYVQLIQKNRTDLGLFVGSLRETIKPIFQTPPPILDFIKQITIYDPPEAIDLTDEMAKISEIEASLTRWHRDISGSDRRWHQALDRWPVVVMFAAATMATAQVASRL